MAEVNIMSVAGDFSIGLYEAKNWLCRDDNDDYWTVVRDTDGSLRVYKSTDEGANWILKKTLTNEDWTNGDPLPTSCFQLINLKGLDKVYLFVASLDKIHVSGWIFNVTADTNAKDMDYLELSSYYVDLCYPHAAYDEVNSRLIVTYRHSTGGSYFLKITLAGGISLGGGALNHPHLAYYISPTEGYGYVTRQSGENIQLFQKNNGVGDYWSDITNVSKTFSSPFYFNNIVTDSDGNPVVGVCYKQGSDYYFGFVKFSKTGLTEISSSTLNIGTTVPEIVVMSIDGNNNLYFVYTDGSDKEAYYRKHDGSTWGSATKISSDNDGQLVVPEIRSPIAANKILVTYQATA